jgi:hypothetical protein
MGIRAPHVFEHINDIARTSVAKGTTSLSGHGSVMHNHHLDQFGPHGLIVCDGPRMPTSFLGGKKAAGTAFSIEWERRYDGKGIGPNTPNGMPGMGDAGEPPNEEDAPSGGPGANQFGGMMGQGFVPPGQFEDLLNLIGRASQAAAKAENASKFADMAAASAGVAGQQAVVRMMHMTKAHACLPEPGVMALAASSPVNIGTVLRNHKRDRRRAHAWSFFHPL